MTTHTQPGDDKELREQIAQLFIQTQPELDYYDEIDDIMALISQKITAAESTLINQLSQVTFNAVMSGNDPHAAIEDFIAKYKATLSTNNKREE